MLVGRLTAGKSDNATFFRGERRSPWYIVAFGMVGASISGVSFVSVPGMVLHGDMTYLQTCMGFILGYFVVAYVLMPIYYRLNLTSIYTVLRGVNDEAYRTGAAFFIFSKLLGSAAKFFVPCLIISQTMQVPFPLTALLLFVLIWLYTRRGGIRTIVWTDSLQTLSMLIALILIICQVYSMLGYADMVQCIGDVMSDSHASVFRLGDWHSSDNFFKCFLSGIFIVIVMTGLDQDMMQKNLTCRNLREAQRNMCCYGFAFLPVNMLFLVLGVMLVMLCRQTAVPLPDKPDDLMLIFAASGRLGSIVLLLFSLGIVAASFSSADSALTALTTTMCVDICRRPNDEKLRCRMHILMAVLFLLCTLVFHQFRGSSLIDVIYTLVSYTYGPLLGLYSFALLHKGRRITTRWAVPIISISSPLLCLLISNGIAMISNYHFGYELLMLNGFITYIGLRLCAHSSSQAEALV